MISSLIESLNTKTRQRRAAFLRPELYDKTASRWITIGGVEKDGEKHHGGTHVKVSSSGHIQAGPQGLEGKHVDDLSGKSKSTESRKFPTAGESIKAGKSFNEYMSPISKAFVNEEIPEDHPDWKALTSPDAVGINDYADARAVYGQHVKTDMGHYGTVTDVADDGKSVIVTHPDGKTSRHYASGLTHLGAYVKAKAGSLGGAGMTRAVAYLAPRLAAEAHAKGENISETMRRHGMDPVKNMVARKAIADESEKLREQEKPKMSDAWHQARAKGQEQAPAPPQPQPADDRWKLKHPTDKPEGPKDAHGQLFDKNKPTPEWAGGAPGAAEQPALKNGPPPGVRSTPDGRWVGSTVVPAKDLAVDSNRFQYKISNIDPTTGTTAELKGVKRYNPDFGGQLLVWHDPEDGKTYVVNGHHRAELAKRSEHWEPDEFGSGWQGDMAVRYIPARSAVEARAVGALANIAEGRGTATDAAKFLRDVKGGADQLAQYGVSLRGKVAQDAVVLSKLAPDVFNDMARGIIEESRGLAIARHLDDPDLQSKLNRMVKERERKDGRSVPDSHVAEMSREMSLAGKAKVGGGGGGLFGDDDHEESLVFQRADLKAALRRELTQERNTFKAVSSGQRVKRITGAGSNQLDVDTNKSRAQQADEALFVFDKLANSRGELSDAIQQHAAQLFQQPNKRNKLLASLKAKAIDILDRAGADASGVQPGADSAGGAAGRQPATLGFSRTAATGARAYAPPPLSGEVTGRDLVLAFAREFAGNVERYARARPAKGQGSLLFDEQKHPREDNGEFARKGSGGHLTGATTATTPAATTPAATFAKEVPPSMAASFIAAFTAKANAATGDDKIVSKGSAAPAIPDMVASFREAFAAKALAPPTAPLPGQRDLFDPQFNTPLDAPFPRADKGRYGDAKPTAPAKPAAQANLFHGLNDLPGQQSLFGDMDLGAAKKPAPSAPSPKSNGAKLGDLMRSSFPKLPKGADVVEAVGEYITRDEAEEALKAAGIDELNAADLAFDMKADANGKVNSKTVVIVARSALNRADEEGRRKRVIDAVGADHVAMFEVPGDERGTKYIVHPSTRQNQGKWQLSRMDKNGPMGHSAFDTKEEALASAVAAHPKGMMHNDGDADAKLVTSSAANGVIRSHGGAAQAKSPIASAMNNRTRET